MDQIASMRTFVAVVDSGGFRAAAQRLGNSPAMVSKTIAGLEDRLGIRLLNRNSRHISLTEEGRVYLDRSRSLLDELDDLERSMVNRAPAISGRIALTAPVWMANPVFTAILGSFMRRYPDVRIDMNLSGRRANLLDEGYDLALRVGENREPGLISRVIGKVNFQLLASPAWMEREGQPRQITDLRGRALLAYEGFAGRQSVALGKMIGGEGLAMTIAMSSENETLLRLAALEGLGAAFLPDWLTQHDVASGALVSVLEDNPELNASIHAVFPSRRLMPSRVRLLIDHLASTGLQI